MKCIPITLFGLFVVAAIFVIEIDEVLEAKIASGLAITSNYSKIYFFMAKFSMIASTIISEFLKPINS